MKVFRNFLLWKLKQILKEICAELLAIKWMIFKLRLFQQVIGMSQNMYFNDVNSAKQDTWAFAYRAKVQFNKTLFIFLYRKAKERSNVVKELGSLPCS